MEHGIVGHCGIDIRWLGVHHRAGHPPPLLERCDTHVRLQHNGTTAWTTTQLSVRVQHVKPALFCRFPGHRAVEDVAAVGLRHGHALPISILPTPRSSGLYIPTVSAVVLLLYCWLFNPLTFLYQQLFFSRHAFHCSLLCSHVFNPLSFIYQRLIFAHLCSSGFPTYKKSVT